MQRERNHEISDLETAVLGLGAEVEALNMTLRDLLPLLVGEDDRSSSPVVPEWVNSRASSSRDEEPADPLDEIRAQALSEIRGSFASEAKEDAEGTPAYPPPDSTPARLCPPQAGRGL
jgi:hypothetical protein